MASERDVDAVAGVLFTSIGLLLRRVRQLRAADGDLPLPQSAALSRLDRSGPTTSAELAKQEQISAQSMGATIGALEARGLVERQPDPGDGRRSLLSLTDDGREVLRNRRSAKTQRLADALADEFTPAELQQLLVAAPLIERLAQRI